MSENKFNISDLLETHRRDRERLHWEGTFRDYFELVTQNPGISKLSHARVCDMILANGVDKINEGSRDEVARYKFFAEELFGIARLRDMLCAHTETPLDQLQKAVLESVENFSRGASQADDVTLLLIRYRAASAHADSDVPATSASARA